MMPLAEVISIGGIFEAVRRRRLAFGVAKSVAGMGAESKFV